MAALTMERGEPEVSRFIDSFKLSQDMESRRAKFGGDTSLPLNSDGYEDKQRSLRDERHKDWLIQQEKPQVIRNALFEEQRQMEQEKLMARRRSPPRPAQRQEPQMDYNRVREQASAEDKRAYQDYMKAKEERYCAMRGRPVTPAGGLDIGGYDRQVKETAQAKKKEYKEMLDQQQMEHKYLIAHQGPEIAILDRSAQQSQYLANKPPPGPGHSRGRDEAYKTESQTRPIPERPRYGQPPFTGENRNQIEAEGERLNRDILERRSSPANQPPRSPMKPANPEWLKVPMNDDERPAELGTPLAFKTNSYSHQPPPAPERTPVSREVQLYEKYDRGVEGLFERPAQSSDRPRSRRSTDSARKYSPTKQEIVALPVLSPRRTKNTLYEDSEEVCSKRREASKERQKEYNDFLKDKAETQRHNDEVRQQHHDMKPAEVVKNAFYSSDNYERFHKENQRIQCEEYRDFLSKKAGTEVRNRDWKFDDKGTLELRGDDAVQTKQRELRVERQKEYNTFMSQV